MLHKITNKIIESKITYINRILEIFFYTSLIIISSKINIPFYPVPLTMQPLAVIFLITNLSTRQSFSAILTYLILGMMFNPLFSGISPNSFLFLPVTTGGYLIGMLLSSLPAQKIMNIPNIKPFYKESLVYFLSIFIIYSCGYLWLANVIGFQAAFSKGILPFLLGDLLVKYSVFAALQGFMKKNK